MSRNVFEALTLQRKARALHIKAAVIFAIGWLQSAALERVFMPGSEMAWIPNALFWTCAVVAFVVWILAVASAYRADSKGEQL